ncbi:MAG: aminomethyl-transferring glycine dehydrogenase [Flavobacteriales bacterium]|jgi:glycine dehydrogenase|tara:strand:+ start:1511 stop:4387 length:2877 start_codon:yes stop_codon:yes gene_type:complete
MKLYNFSDRHIGPRDSDFQLMIDKIGVKSINELIEETIPSQIMLNRDMDLPEALSEIRFSEHMKSLAQKNQIYRSYIGMGYYNTILPAVIHRNILENPGWYTSYTAYQAEISQGRLEALLNFQTMVSDLTAMDLANASLLDEGTSAAEAMIMLYNTRSRAQKKEGIKKFFVSELCFPQTIDLLKTRSEPLEIELVIGNHETVEIDNTFYGVILQYPAKYGEAIDYSAFTKKVKEKDISVVVAADLLSLSLLTPPGEWGADVVIGTTQRFGIPLGYGGPHAAYFATSEKYKRNIPGRIIGVSEDVNGNRALRMALQTREQHIKREKATSNICTAQALLAVMAGMYGVFHGPDGIKSIGQFIHKNTQVLAEGLKQLGFHQLNDNYFDTLLVSIGNVEMSTILEYADQAKMNFNLIDDKHVSISVDEKDDIDSIKNILEVFAKSCSHSDSSNLIDEVINRTHVKNNISDSLVRTSSFMQHDIFNKYHSETEMMRYIKSLENKDFSLTNSMIPLGSCTMKLNAATQLFALSWPEFNNIHPFAPTNQAMGYQQIFEEIESMLCEITGFDAMSLQPNSGAQGEYAGLMVIRAYHLSRGDKQRNICLIPSSAHGTNPASAVMAGMQVVVTPCDENGNIDVKVLKEKALEYKDNLAALMITYPSTHGVFEDKIIEITSAIHENGGQVYMDGANMNAQVGLTNPGIIGADVCHLNLHKTFAIPHGGGGPGVGPIGVVKHLAEFLPNNSLVEMGGASGMSISSAPWGSALALTISYAYIKMLGASGLKKSTEIAILNANYIKERLSNDYSVLYTGEKNRVAHEMIIDFRDFKKDGIEVVDIAKRLMDYGFHAPTVSFPVANTVMIEPTESESLEEIDRFCDALLSIKQEINDVISGACDAENNVLKNSPHTLDIVANDVWDFPYSREKAAFPLPYLRKKKMWPTVRRVNDAYGDRNLICSCAPVSDYQ